jgi:Transposase DDE domain group 1
MRRSPRNVTIAFSHAGLTHYGGLLFFNEFVRLLQLRRFLTRHLSYSRRNRDYSVAQTLLALIYPIVLGLDRIETASLLRADETFPSHESPEMRRLIGRLPDVVH